METMVSSEGKTASQMLKLMGKGPISFHGSEATLAWLCFFLHFSSLPPGSVCADGDDP